MTEWTDLAGASRHQRQPKPKGLHPIMKRLVPAFAVECRRYHTATKDHAFAYREKQVHSVLFPALRSFTEGAFREQPVQRNGKRGWADYWLSFRDRSHWVEVKHGFTTLSPETGLSQEEQAKWRTMNDQLSAIESLPSGDALLGLFIVVHYVASDSRGQAICQRAASWERHLQIVGSLQQSPSTESPSWHGVWQVPADMQLAKWEQRRETYPAVSFIAALRRIP